MRETSTSWRGGADRRDDEFERGRTRASELEAELRAAREEVREGFE